MTCFGPPLGGPFFARQADVPRERSPGCQCYVPPKLHIIQRRETSKQAKSSLCPAGAASPSPAMPLTIFGREPTSIFSLYRRADENSASIALGWALDKVPHFRGALLQALFPHTPETDTATISLQQGGDDGGFTDIEIRLPTGHHVLIEAKLGWELPTERQLRRYIRRLGASPKQRCRLVTVSAMSKAVAQRRQPSEMDSVELVHLSWDELRDLASQSLADTRVVAERLWLTQLTEHLAEFTTMDRVTSNEVLVVPLNVKRIRPEYPYTWTDVVEKDRSYFHPIDAHWTVTPPNYVAFRYHGRLQFVHHVSRVQIVFDVSTVNPHWPTTDRDHFLYTLGPAMAPREEVRTGGIYATAATWCAIDTLLSGEFKTIKDARDETVRRRNAQR